MSKKIIRKLSLRNDSTHLAIIFIPIFFNKDYAERRQENRGYDR
jgi:hypothetical protein